MRSSYYPLRRAVGVRPTRRSIVDGRLSWLAVAALVLLAQGAPLGGRDEMAKAEPLANHRIYASALAPVQAAFERQATAGAPPFLSAPVDVITCPQPPVGSFLSGGSTCMRTTLPDAGSEESRSTVASAPASAELPQAAPVTVPMPATEPSAVTEAAPEPSRSNEATPIVTASVPQGPAVSDGVTSQPPAVKQAAAPAAKPVKLTAMDARLRGRWTPKMAGCGRAGADCLNLVIGEKLAKAGAASCRFSEITRDGGNRWKALATCSNDGDRWTAHVQLSLTGKKLTWNSERGRQDYIR